MDADTSNESKEHHVPYEPHSSETVDKIASALGWNKRPVTLTFRGWWDLDVPGYRVCFGGSNDGRAHTEGRGKWIRFPGLQNGDDPEIAAKKILSGLDIYYNMRPSEGRTAEVGSWQAQYRCRRCGFESPGGAVFPDSAAAHRQLTMALSSPSPHRRVVPESVRYQSHSCPDGGFGVAELLGMAPATPDEET